MKSIGCFLVGLLLISACTSVKTPGSKTLFTVDNESVTADEFKYVYQKNNFNRSEEISSADDIKNYLDLYINFKLKVREAESRGLHESEAFKTELEGYRKQLAKPYLTETAVSEQLAKQAYERLQLEVNAAHILIGIPGTGTPEDTLAAYQQAITVREQALKGGEFTALASEYSKDPSAATNGGNLGYFSALQMVYPFEEAAYRTEIGAISQPVRTQFGYHLVKVLDRRPARGKVKVSHIMIRAAEGISDMDSLSASKQINEIYQRLQNGGVWDQLCQQFSDDLTTRSKAGALPWLGAGDMNNIPSFEKTAFELDQIGEISLPVQTPYGWHIIRLDDKKDLEPYEEKAEELKQKIARDSRSELNQQALIKRLKSENQFVAFADNRALSLDASSDSLFLGSGSYGHTASKLSLPVFKIKDKDYLIEDFYKYIAKNNKPGQFRSSEEAKEKLYQEFERSSLIRYEEDHLAEKYEDYKMLFQEYRDGILLFQLMDEMVWDKAIKDTTGLKNFFAAHHDQYVWEPRAKATVYSASKSQIVEQIKAFLRDGHYEQEKFDFARAAGDENQAFSEIEYKILDRTIVRLKQNPGVILDVNYDKSQDRYNQLKDSLIQYLENNKVAKSQVNVASGNHQANTFLLNLRCTTAKCLEIALNEKDPLNLKVEEGLYERGSHPVVDQVAWEVGVAEIDLLEQHHLVDIAEIIPKTPKELKEIRGQVISDYQTQLEEEWVLELRAKYLVNVDENVLETTIESLEN
ncbi:MAG: peptidylprolyl isomerase [Cyclobacteriaceae bacterium]